MNIVFINVWHYIVKVLIGSVAFILIVSFLGDMGLFIAGAVLWVIHDLLWGPGYDC